MVNNLCLVFCFSYTMILHSTEFLVIYKLFNDACLKCLYIHIYNLHSLKMVDMGVPKSLKYFYANQY